MRLTDNEITLWLKCESIQKYLLRVNKTMVMCGTITLRHASEDLERDYRSRQKEVPPMSHRIRDRASAETPIERIFEKVMRRKMTLEERIYFHIERRIKPPLRVSTNRQTRAA